MQGIYLVNDTGHYVRPVSKREVKDHLARKGPRWIVLEPTSLFGSEYDGPISDAPDGTFYFVGPDPYKSRKFYGSIVKVGSRITLK